VLEVEGFEVGDKTLLCTLQSGCNIRWEVYHFNRSAGMDCMKVCGVVWGLVKNHQVL